MREAGENWNGIFAEPMIVRSRHSSREGNAFVFCESGWRLLSADGDYAMSDHVYKKIELVGSSPNSIEEAVVNALARAQKTVRNMRWFEVVETRGHIEDGKINHWQVTVKVGFTLDQ